MMKNKISRFLAGLLTVAILLPMGINCLHMDAKSATWSDAKKNLMDALRFACQEVGGVYLVFSGEAILGTRAKKMVFSRSH